MDRRMIWVLKSPHKHWYNCQGRVGEGHHVPKVSCFSSFHPFYPTDYPPLPWDHYPHFNSRPICPPSSDYAPPLLCYLDPLLHFNSRYWLENFHDLFPVPRNPLLPFPATFNLITGFLSVPEWARSYRDNRGASGFTNTLPRGDIIHEARCVHFSNIGSPQGVCLTSFTL